MDRYSILKGLEESFEEEKDSRVSSWDESLKDQEFLSIPAAPLVVPEGFNFAAVEEPLAVPEGFTFAAAEEPPLYLFNANESDVELLREGSLANISLSNPQKPSHAVTMQYMASEIQRLRSETFERIVGYREEIRDEARTLRDQQLSLIKLCTIVVLSFALLFFGLSVVNKVF